MHSVPQPAVERIVGVPGHPLVVGVRPGQSDIVAHTAAVWSQASGAILYFAYADPSRVAEEEFADGTLRHVGLDPDADDDGWHHTEQQLRDWLTGLNLGAAWEFRYLAGRPDRALTHLARAVDACAIVVGARRPHSSRFGLGRSLGQDLARHQHRPVLAVPLEVVDWKLQ
jgi:nucleotide-binding universal stress UspA family protein